MPERPATWDDIIRAEAKTAKVPPELALAIAQTESNFDPTATSPKGARGMFQLMPDTAKELGVDPDDPVQNIRGGLKYFRQQLDRHGGNVEQALAAYNWGPGNVSRAGEQWRETAPPETQQYITKILGRLPAAPSPQKLPSMGVQEFTRGIGSRPRTSSVVATPPPPTFTESIVSGISPRTREGRRNIAGGIGDVIGTAAGAVAGVAAAPYTFGTSIPSGPIVGGALGSAAGGAVAEGLEDWIGEPPPSVMGDTFTGSRVGDAALEQGAYAVGGRLLTWPLRAAGKRLVATRVGRFASQHFADVLTTAKDALTTARTAASDAVSLAREQASAALGATRTAAAEREGKAQTFGREGVEKATQAAQAGTEAVRSRFGRVGTAPPSVAPTVAGQRAQQVIQGPARQAREEVGQLVEDAAASGPDVDIKALKAEAQRILGEEIRPPQQAFPRAAAEAGEVDPAVAKLQELAANLTPENIAKLPPSQQVQAQAIHTALAKAQEDQAQIVLKHPAMGVLGRILNAEDSVPFAAAHQFKRELDDAIGTAWDRSVRSRVTNITKVMRGTLRDALSVHEPYNQATAAYQAIAPLYTKGLAPKLRRAAVEAPEAIVRLIKPNDPTQLRMLRDLLVTQPGKVGQQQEGQLAWDSVRSAWTHERIIKGSIEKLDDRIAKLDPDFLETMYGDGPGSQVLNNLRSISQAFKDATAAGTEAVAGAQARAAAGVSEAKMIGRSATEAVRATGRQDVRATARAGRQYVGQKIGDVIGARTEGQTFARSSVGPAASRDVGGDVLRAGGLGWRSIWGAQSIMRLLRGPKSAELIQYAAYSPEGTQLLVDALTGPEPGLAMAELLRMSGLSDLAPGAPEAPASGSPNAGMVGQPPP